MLHCKQEHAYDVRVGHERGGTVRQTLTLPALPRDLLRVIGMWRWILLGQEEDHWAEAARGDSTIGRGMTQGESPRESSRG